MKLIIALHSTYNIHRLLLHSRLSTGQPAIVLHLKVLLHMLPSSVGFNYTYMISNADTAPQYVWRFHDAQEQCPVWGHTRLSSCLDSSTGTSSCTCIVFVNATKPSSQGCNSHECVINKLWEILSRVHSHAASQSGTCHCKFTVLVPFLLCVCAKGRSN